MAFLCSFDGPKGVGKSTVIQVAAECLQQAGWAVSVLAEKDLLRLTHGGRLERSHADFQADPGERSERALLDCYREARVAASAGRLADHPAQIVLLDRWYPSDAVFRRYVDHAQIVQSNLGAGVRRPDVAFAVTCAPAISWARAHQRERRLDSRVISSLQDHEASTIRFDVATRAHGWRLIRTDNDGPLVLGQRVVGAINEAMACSECS